MTGRPAVPIGVAAGLAAGLALLASTARADWLYPDLSYREAQADLRAALRDTIGHSGETWLLDTLGVALLRLGKLDDAERVLRRVLEASPQDGAACAGLGKLALFADRLAEAESLLSRASAAGVREADLDLFAARYRAGEHARAADLAAELPGQQAREAKLRALAEEGAYRMEWDGAPVELPFRRAYPVPLVRARINGEEALLAVDTGAGELLLDPSAASRLGVHGFPGNSVAFWSGRRVSVGEALVQRLELGGIRIERVPAQTYSMRTFSMVVNPQSPRIDGVMGVDLLRRFTPTIDYRRAKLVLSREPPAPQGEVHRLPLQVWGEHELTVWGTLNGGRPMALVVASGVPQCGVAATRGVFDEIGLKQTPMSAVFKGTGRLVGGPGWAQVNVPDVVVDGAKVGRVAGWSGPLEERELWWHGVRRDGMLSHDFLRNYRCTFDWARRELLLEEKP